MMPDFSAGVSAGRAGVVARVAAGLVSGVIVAAVGLDRAV